MTMTQDAPEAAKLAAAFVALSQRLLSFSAKCRFLQRCFLPPT
jgi:hypothetical protein